MNTIPCDCDIGRWDQFLVDTYQRGSSALAKKVLMYTESRTHAIDLGAGAMNDSDFFLEEGFESVLAVDASPETALYAKSVARKYGRRFEFRNSRFSDIDYQPESADLVHSNYALHFHGKTGFDILMNAVTSCVRLGGLLSAVFLGSEDSWRETKGFLPYLTEGEVEKFLVGFEKIEFRESKRDGHMTDRTPKFWHTFEVIARRVEPVL